MATIATSTAGVTRCPTTTTSGNRRATACSDRHIRAGLWDTTTVFGAPRLRGRTLGLIGCGRIGTALALRAKALGLRVVAYDPYRPDGLDKALGIERVYHLDELLGQAEFVSLHCPLTRETRHILNDTTLARLPRGAYVINTARGSLADETALAAAVMSGQLAGVAVDVLDGEEKAATGTSPLLAAAKAGRNVLITPHIGGATFEAIRQAECAVIDVLAGALKA